MIIVKFGGVSVADASAMRKALEIVKREYEKGEKLLVVLSACGGVTNALLELAGAAAKLGFEESKKALNNIVDRHKDTCDNLIKDKYIKELTRIKIDRLSSELNTLFEGVSLLKQCTPKSGDAIVSFGERLSTTLFEAACRAEGLDSELFDAGNAMKSDAAYSNAKLDMSLVEYNATKYLAPLLNAGKIVVTQGFLASAPDGSTTTLGRGGSDFSASVFGSVLGAREIWISTDVNGALSADPRIIPNAKTVESMSYDEVAEISFFGAKVLHPETIKPAITKNIPVRVMNTFDPDGKSTLITREVDTPRRVKTLVLNQNAVALEFRIGEAAGDFKALRDLIGESKIYSLSAVDDKFSAIIDDDGKYKNNKELHKILSEAKKISLICACPVEREVKKIFTAIEELRKSYNLIELHKTSSNLSALLAVARKDGVEILKALHKLLAESD